MRLYHLLTVPILATAGLVAVGCEQDDAVRDSDTVWTYELTAEWSDGKSGEINARYEYGNRAARMSSKTGKLKTTVKTAGPKKVSIDAGKGNDREVKCKIVASAKDRTWIVENNGNGRAACNFTP